MAKGRECERYRAGAEADTATEAMVEADRRVRWSVCKRITGAMNPVPDRTKMRREYLRKKAKAYSKVTVGSVLFPVAVTGTVVCAGMAAL